MAYITDSEVTVEYVQSLCDRCGFTNVTENYEFAFSALDLDGNVNFYSNLPTARDSLIMSYVVQQNS